MAVRWDPSRLICPVGLETSLRPQQRPELTLGSDSQFSARGNFVGLWAGPAAARGRRKLSLCFGGAGALLSAGLKVLEPVDGETVRVTCGDALLYAAWRILMAAMPQLQLSNHLPAGTSMVCKHEGPPDSASASELDLHLTFGGSRHKPRETDLR